MGDHCSPRLILVDRRDTPSTASTNTVIMLAFFWGGPTARLRCPHSPESRSGGSGAAEARKDAFTFGVDYEFRLNRFLGVGAFYDHAYGDLRTNVVAPGVFIHPFSHFTVVAAPGLERHEGHNEFVFRLASSYDFPINRLALAPTFAVDFLEGRRVYVYGVTIHVGF